MPKITKKAPKKVEEEVAIPVVAEEVQAPVLPANACPSCSGTGKQNSDDLCVLCQGRGTTL